MTNFLTTNLEQTLYTSESIHLHWKSKVWGQLAPKMWILEPNSPNEILSSRLAPRNLVPTVPMFLQLCPPLYHILEKLHIVSNYQLL